MEDLNQINRGLISQFINSLANEVRQAIPKVTGRTAQNIEVEITDTSGSILAPSWISIFQDGRKPGGMPPVNEILAWIEAKGIIPRSISKQRATSQQRRGSNTFRNATDQKKSQESMAWAIAVNMQKNGNTLWRALHGGQIQYSPIRVEFNRIFSRERIDSFVNVFAGKYESIIESEILSIE